MRPSWPTRGARTLCLVLVSRFMMDEHCNWGLRRYQVVGKWLASEESMSPGPGRVNRTTRNWKRTWNRTFTRAPTPIERLDDDMKQRSIL